MGKFLAVYLYGGLLSILGILVLGVFAVTVLEGSITHFTLLTPFLAVTCLYGCIASFVWCGIFTAISALLKRSRSTSYLSLLLVMGLLVGLPFLRINFSGIYLPLQLFHLDIQYHLGNVYAWFIEIIGALPRLSLWQESLNMFTGVFSTASSAAMNQNISSDFLEFTNYYLPPVSFTFLIGFVGILLFCGYIRFHGRELA